MSGTYPTPGETNLARLVQSIRDLYAGRNNAFGEFTLAVAPATTTTVRAPNASVNSIPLWVPLTENAAEAHASGDMYISDRQQGEFTVTHPASADVDRTFGYVALG